MEEETLLGRVLARVGESSALDQSLRVSEIVLSCFAGDAAWLEMRQHLQLLAAIGDTSERPTVANARNGTFSLFKVSLFFTASFVLFCDKVKRLLRNWSSSKPEVLRQSFSPLSLSI